MSNKLSPMDMLNRVREKAKLSTNNEFANSIAIKLGKPGKIKLQLLANSPDYLFKPRTQHMIPTLPHEDNKDEKWLVADCKGEGCPICIAANNFKKTNITVDEINDAYTPKFPYKSVRALFTQPEHFLLCARVLSDQADDGSYLPKDAELGSTQLIQFNKMALNNLMSAYEDFIEDNEEEEDVPPLFAIFDDEDTAKSLTITCRITTQPYSCSFSFNKAVDVKKSDVDINKLSVLEETKEVPSEHYEKCVKRIRDIQNYFFSDSNHSLGINDIDNIPVDTNNTIGVENTISPSSQSSAPSETNFTATDDDLDNLINSLDLDV